MAMKRRRTVLTQGFQVIGSGVAFVAGEAVLRIDDVPFFHARVAVGFGEDGSSGNRNAASVTLNERLLLDENIELHGIDEQVIRLNRKLLQSGGHSLAAGLIDVPSVDSLSIDFCDGPSKSVLVDTHGKFRTAFSGKFFRVIETNNAALGIENDRGGNDWAEERAAASFIETGDAHPAKLSRLSLETGRAESVHCAEILARRAGRTRLLMPKRGNRIDPHGSAGRYVVCRERYDGQQ
jgi:hypothetical protein